MAPTIYFLIGKKGFSFLKKVKLTPYIVLDEITTTKSYLFFLIYTENKYSLSGKLRLTPYIVLN